MPAPSSHVGPKPFPCFMGAEPLGRKDESDEGSEIEAEVEDCVFPLWLASLQLR